jgi:KipI family sensor histidine kinase inhibitor
LADRGFALLFALGTPMETLHALAARLRENVVGGVRCDAWATPNRITVDPTSALNPDDHARLQNALRELVATHTQIPIVRTATQHVLSVRFSTRDSPDLDRVASHTGLSCEALIALILKPTYDVAWLGFAPGFPYLTGLDQRLRTPRLETPRTRVNAGSVAIAGGFLGIYPRSTPGGWNVIGHIDVTLFDVTRDPPSLFAPGDTLKLVRES